MRGASILRGFFKLCGELWLTAKPVGQTERTGGKDEAGNLCSNFAAFAQMMRTHLMIKSSLACLQTLRYISPRAPSGPERSFDYLLLQLTDGLCERQALSRDGFP